MFLDTGYFVALLNARDNLHTRAAVLAGEFDDAKSALVTTDAVLIELANFFARGTLRKITIGAIRTLRRTSGLKTVMLDRPLLERAEARYATHSDKEWSLTDCISMEVMLDAGCRDVATADGHFAQAGFRPLMRR